MYELGTGVLSWNSAERISDRYGVVKLFATPDPDATVVGLDQTGENRHGQIIAVVKKTRKSTHVGDWFYGIYPSTPKLAEHIVLGTGTLFFAYHGVGLLPDDGRSSWWLDVRALYRVHEQTVTLFFRESPNN